MSTDAKPGLLALAPSDAERVLGGPGRARAVYAEVRAGRDPFTAPTFPAGARRRLAAACADDALRVEALARSSDGAEKLLLGLADGRSVESVLIPEQTPSIPGRGEARRTTLCVSTQVGCARGCTFCLTATMKLVRNLGRSEIVGQVAAGLRRVAEGGLPVLRNVVLMGMGEPLDNLTEVAAALDVITTSGLGLGVGPGHVTVSTVGPSPRAILDARRLPGHFAWSLHAADDAIRARLVPTARHAVGELRDAFGELLAARGRDEPLFVELTLLDGVNDGDADARRVTQLFEGFGREVRLNLLPMNPIAPGAGSNLGAPLRPSPSARVARFEAILRDAGYFAKVRRARGAEESAACGQLAVAARRGRLRLAGGSSSADDPTRPASDAGGSA